RAAGAGARPVLLLRAAERAPGAAAGGVRALLGRGAVRRGDGHGYAHVLADRSAAPCRGGALPAGALAGGAVGGGRVRAGAGAAALGLAIHTGQAAGGPGPRHGRARPGLAVRAADGSARGDCGGEVIPAVVVLPRYGLAAILA